MKVIRFDAEIKKANELDVSADEMLSLKDKIDKILVKKGLIMNGVFKIFNKK